MQFESCKLKAPVPDSIPGLGLALFPVFRAQRPIKAHDFHPPTTRSSLRLQELSDTKSQVIGLAAQDLQGPLTSILLYCDMLAESPQTPQVAKQVGAIRALGTRMGGGSRNSWMCMPLKRARSKRPRS